MKRQLGKEQEMLKNTLLSNSVLAATLVTMPVRAALYDRGHGLIYDDELDIFWLQDANYAQTSGYDADGSMTWAEAKIWAANLSYGGYNDWRLPSVRSISYWDHPGQGYNKTKGELGHMFYNNLGNTERTSILNNVSFTDAGDGSTKSFKNVQSGAYWYSEEYRYSEGYSDGPYVWVFDNRTGNQFYGFQSKGGYGWAVRDREIKELSGLLSFIEAESMALSGGYAVEDNAAASGGQLIRRLTSGGHPATASTRYKGRAGTYDIAVSYFDESDGMSSLEFHLKGQTLDQWIADEVPICRDCDSPGASTLKTRVVAKGIRLSPGDKLTLQGTGEHYEYARFDKIIVSPVSSNIYEAEMMTLDGGYVVEDNAAASGGQLIRRLASGGYVATASTEYNNPTGTSDITVSYFDESDGMSSLAFLLNGEILDQWIADGDPVCSDCASPGASTLRTREVAKEIRLSLGDELTLQGTGEHYEYARFDKITLSPVSFKTLEAEMMILEGGFVVEGNAEASGGQLIRGNRPFSPGKASAPFMGIKGQYDITVAYFDEYDGISNMAFFLNNQLIDRWLADENPSCGECASPDENTLRSRVVARGIEISPGDEIRLESTINQYEFGRFDKVDFTRTLSP